MSKTVEFTCSQLKLVTKNVYFYTVDVTEACNRASSGYSPSGRNSEEVGPACFDHVPSPIILIFGLALSVGESLVGVRSWSHRYLFPLSITLFSAFPSYPHISARYKKKPQSPFFPRLENPSAKKR